MNRYIKLTTSLVLTLGLLVSTTASKFARALDFSVAVVTDIQITATSNGLYVDVYNDDITITQAFYSVDGGPFNLMNVTGFTYLGGGNWIDHHFSPDARFECGVYLKVRATQVSSLDGSVSTLERDFTLPPCSTLGSIRGTAFKDGAPFGGAWYKITDGGNWYVCGTVGPDGTFGVPVTPGVYYLMPLNLEGLRASEVMRVVVEGGKASLNNNINYVSDPTARHESCDAYNPPRPVTP